MAKSSGFVKLAAFGFLSALALSSTAFASSGLVGISCDLCPQVGSLFIPASLLLVPCAILFALSKIFSKSKFAYLPRNLGIAVIAVAAVFVLVDFYVNWVAHSGFTDLQCISREYQDWSLFVAAGALVSSCALCPLLMLFIPSFLFLIVGVISFVLSKRFSKSKHANLFRKLAIVAVVAAVILIFVALFIDQNKEIDSQTGSYSRWRYLYCF